MSDEGTPRSLADWLSWQETLHPRAIDLGLDRVVAVRDALGLAPPPFTVATVAGTNGKGSCVAFASTLLRARGLRVGAFTSPHLVRYNERVVVDGVEASDDELCDAFAQVDAARGGVSLTYFEWSTLAAMLVFRARGCDAAVLEVGMGGRLDATNAFDADAAAVVSVGLDHMEWLGRDREAIGAEKAGVFRAGRPAVVADPAPPASVLARIEAVGAQPVRVGAGYRYDVRRDGRWSFAGVGLAYDDLPPPALAGAHQYGNAAAAIALVGALPDVAPPTAGQVASMLATTRVRGRLETVASAPTTLVDVAHNPDGARVLAAALAAAPVAGPTVAVCGMLGDKVVAATLAALDGVVSHWSFATLDGPRGTRASALAAHARDAGLRGTVSEHPDVADAIADARSRAGAAGRVVVFGSFLTAAAALSVYH